MMRLMAKNGDTPTLSAERLGILRDRGNCSPTLSTR